MSIYSQSLLTLRKKIPKKILNLKLLVMWEYRKLKTILQKVKIQIDIKKFLRLKKLKILSLENVASNHNVEVIVGSYTK